MERDKLLRCIEAARWSPSSSNRQPWGFTAGYKGDQIYQRLFASLVPQNQQWVASVPVLLLIYASKTVVGSGSAGSGQNRHYAYDTGQSMAYFTVQAMHEGLHVHQMAGFKPDSVLDLLPDTYEGLTVAAVGYADPGEERMEKKRRDLKDIFVDAFTKE